MSDEMEDIAEGPGRQEIICPRCHKPHYSMRPIMDEYINCECGCHFYAFSYQGLRITMPQEEASYEEVVRNMRRFVVSTGRCSGPFFVFFRSFSGVQTFTRREGGEYDAGGEKGGAAGFRSKTV